jgi:hypothetical protein
MKKMLYCIIQLFDNGSGATGAEGCQSAGTARLGLVQGVLGHLESSGLQRCFLVGRQEALCPLVALVDTSHVRLHLERIIPILTTQ